MRKMWIPMLRRAAQAWLLTMACVGVAHAQLNVEISGVGSSQYPIAIAHFQGEQQAQAHWRCPHFCPAAREWSYRTIAGLSPGAI